jgi:hypothetical protein
MASEAWLNLPSSAETGRHGLKPAAVLARGRETERVESCSRPLLRFCRGRAVRDDLVDARGGPREGFGQAARSIVSGWLHAVACWHHTLLNVDG